MSDSTGPPDGINKLRAPPPMRPSKLAHYADIFERMSDPGLLVDLDTFVVLEVNSACEVIFGFSAQDLLGKSVLTLAPEGHDKLLSKHLRIARRRYFSREFAALFQKPDGKILQVQIGVSVLELANKTGVMQLIAKDVTKVKEAEAKAAKYLEELESANRKLEELSTTDAKTGLANYRHLKNEMTTEHERAERYGSPYAMVFIDIDFFKHYNDKNGHLAGDDALKLVAKIIKNESRGTDLPARYGGEEFAILCRGVAWGGAMVLAERIRYSVERTRFPNEGNQPNGNFTVSIGVSSYPADGVTMEDIFRSSDQALYHSKDAGRNKVTAAAKLDNTMELDPTRSMQITQVTQATDTLSTNATANVTKKRAG